MDGIEAVGEYNTVAAVRSTGGSDWEGDRVPAVGDVVQMDRVKEADDDRVTCVDGGVRAKTYGERDGVGS